MFLAGQQYSLAEQRDGLAGQMPSSAEQTDNWAGQPRISAKQTQNIPINTNLHEKHQPKQKARSPKGFLLNSSILIHLFPHLHHSLQQIHHRLLNEREAHC